MADDFFDDEQELMEAAAHGETPGADHAAEAASASAEAAGRERRTSAGAATAREPRQEDAAASGRQAPPFWMVVAIAAIALLLGVVIGYLMGSSATLAALESEMGSQAQTAETDSDASAYELPEGHPQVEVDEDGTAHVADDTATAGE